MEEKQTFIKNTLHDGNDLLTDYDGVRLCLRTASTNEPNVHPRGDVRAWKAMIMMMMAGVTPDSPTRPL
jgi:hypothetical protein